MKSRRIILFVCVIVVFGGLFRFVISERGAPSSATDNRDGGSGGVRRDEFIALFDNDIELHGLVRDQNGDVVTGATVMLSPVDNPLGEGGRITLTSGGDGRFSVTGLRGASLGVEASKNGYLHLPPLGGPASSSMLDYSSGNGSGKRYENPESPLVLTLHKVGTAGKVSYGERSRWRLESDGAPRTIALDSAKGLGVHGIEFRLWSDAHSRREERGDTSAPFDWTFEAKIPGGGFIWSGSDFAFEAPAEGYREVIRYRHSSKAKQSDWRRIENGRYFVKFADGTFGRITFEIDGGTEPKHGPLSIESWLNLVPGSRNLASHRKSNSGFHGGDPEER